MIAPLTYVSCFSVTPHPTNTRRVAHRTLQPCQVKGKRPTPAPSPSTPGKNSPGRPTAASTPTNSSGRGRGRSSPPSPKAGAFAGRSTSIGSIGGNPEEVKVSVLLFEDVIALVLCVRGGGSLCASGVMIRVCSHDRAVCAVAEPVHAEETASLRVHSPARLKVGSHLTARPGVTCRAPSMTCKRTKARHLRHLVDTELSTTYLALYVISFIRCASPASRQEKKNGTVSRSSACPR